MTFEIYWPDEEKVVQGKPGQSLLEIAEANGIDLDHACGGVCACSTCHVKIGAGAEHLNESSDDEEDQLDDARDVDLTSRLGCQARIRQNAVGGDATLRIVVSIPAWNVNLAQEPPH